MEVQKKDISLIKYKIDSIYELISAMEERFNRQSEKFEQRLKLCEEYIKELIPKKTINLRKSPESLAEDSEDIRWLKKVRQDINPYDRYRPAKEIIIDLLIENAYCLLDPFNGVFKVSGVNIGLESILWIVERLSGTKADLNMDGSRGLKYQVFRIDGHLEKHKQRIVIVNRNYLATLNYEFQTTSPDGLRGKLSFSETGWTTNNVPHNFMKEILEHSKKENNIVQRNNNKN
jgi:hypothetical protein